MNFKATLWIFRLTNGLSSGVLSMPLLIQLCNLVIQLGTVRVLRTGLKAGAHFVTWDTVWGWGTQVKSLGAQQCRIGSKLFPKSLLCPNCAQISLNWYKILKIVNTLLAHINVTGIRVSRPSAMSHIILRPFSAIAVRPDSCCSQYALSSGRSDGRSAKCTPSPAPTPQHLRSKSCSPAPDL